MAIILGNNNANVLTGTSANDVLKGLGGDDALRGLGRNDLLDGGIGRDTMLGGLGNDTYIVGAPGDLVIEDPAGGIDRVLSSISHALRANVENLSLTGLGAINGTGNGLNNAIIGNNAGNILNGLAGNDRLLGRAGSDRLFGGNGIDRLDGGNGNDLLDGGAGNDRMIGGRGNDVYRVNAVGDVVVETGAGIDRIESAVTFNLNLPTTLQVENLTLLGVAPISGGGNNLNNVIVGNNAGNSIGGRNGNDTLIGGLGGDNLVGGLGADIYRYRSTAESTAPFPDAVEFGFGQHDRIDLSAIDANVLVAGNQSFAFVGATGFTGPGQVNFAIQIDPLTMSGRTTVFANVDNYTAPEFIILIPSPFTIPTGVLAPRGASASPADHRDALRSCGAKRRRAAVRRGETVGWSMLKVSGRR